MLRKALALAEEWKKFKKHPEDPAPWTEGRGISCGCERIGGGWFEDWWTRRKGEREAQERRQFIWTAFLVVSGVIGFWAVFLATAPFIEADSVCNERSLSLLSLLCLQFWARRSIKKASKERH